MKHLCNVVVVDVGLVGVPDDCRSDGSSPIVFNYSAGVTAFPFS